MYKVNDDLLYVGTNEQWKSMLNIYVHIIDKESYHIIYSWIDETNFSKPKLKYAMASFDHDEPLLKDFVPKTKASSLLYKVNTD